MRFQINQALIFILVLASPCHLELSPVPTDLKIGLFSEVDDETIFYCQGNIEAKDTLSFEFTDRISGRTNTISAVDTSSILYNYIFRNKYYYLYHQLNRVYFPLRLKALSGDFDIKCKASPSGDKTSVKFTNYSPERNIKDNPLNYSVLSMNTASAIHRCEEETKNSAKTHAVGTFEIDQHYATFFCQSVAFADSESFTLSITLSTVKTDYESVTISASDNGTIYRDFMKNEFNQRYREYFHIDMTKHKGTVTVKCQGKNTGKSSTMTYTHPDLQRSINASTTVERFFLNSQTPQESIGLSCQIFLSELPAFNCSNVKMDIYEINILHNKLETLSCSNPTKSSDKVNFDCNNKYRPPHAGNFKATCSGTGKSDPTNTVSKSDTTFDVYDKPTFTFGSDCMSGMIKGKVRFTCTCTLHSKRPDFFTVVLASSISSIPQKTGEKEITFEHNYSPSISLMTLTCSGKLKATGVVINSQSLRIQYAYGPSTISVTPISGTLTKTSTISIECRLTAGDHSPADTTIVTVHIIKKATSAAIFSGSCSSSDQQSYTCPSWTPTDVGQFTVRCTGVNGVYGNTFNAKSEVTITVNGPPVVRLADCPLDDAKTLTVRGEKNASCTCEMTDPGFPLSQPEWYDKTNKRVASGNPKAVLVVQPSQEKQSFTCIAMSAYRDSSRLEYEVVFIYGPGAISVQPIADFSTIANPPNISCFLSAQGDSPKDKTEVKAEIYSVASGALAKSLNCTFISGTNRTYDCPVWTPGAVGRYKAKCKGYNGIHPELFNASSDSLFAVYGNSTVKLTDCPLDSNNVSVPIVGKKIGACSCELVEPGYPPAQARWYHKDGSVVVSGSPKAVLSVITAINNQTFTCKGVSDYGESQPLQYKAMLIYGPDKVTVGIESNDLKLGYLMVYCEVKRSDVLPDWTTSFAITGVSAPYEFNRTVINLQADTSRTYYKVNTTKVNVKFTVECKVNNTKVTSLGAVATKEVDPDAISNPSVGASSSGVSSESLKIAFGAVGAFLFLWIIILAMCLLKKFTDKTRTDQRNEETSSQSTPPTFSQKQMVTPNGPGQDLVMRQMEMNLPRVSEINPFPGYGPGQPGLNSGWKG